MVSISLYKMNTMVMNKLRKAVCYDQFKYQPGREKNTS